MLRDVHAYLDIDRRTAVESAQSAGRYERIDDPLVIEDPGSGAVRRGRRLVKVERLDPAQRVRLLIRTETGLEPAVVWLGEDGVRAWKSVFRTASDRCKHLGISIYCHAHMLRHGFAVALLEHLQRGHLEALGALGIEQRRHYQMVFGDPLNWVRRALGHRSVETTQKYLHTLAELEMATRLALFGDAFDNDPRPAGAATAAVTS